MPLVFKHPPQPDDVFVVAEILPNWMKNALDCSHAAFRAIPNPRAAMKAHREECQAYGGDMRFTKLLRRSELLDWAAANRAKLLMSMEPLVEPDYGAHIPEAAEALQ